ncbi:MAG TPA: hypothetical protein VGD31_05085, partial [Sphingobacteriaceae bacterium]
SLIKRFENRDYLNPSTFHKPQLMETFSVYLSQLPQVFRKIQNNKIPVKIYNHSGQWSDHFFQVLEIKEIKDKGYDVTVLILFDPETSDATALDMKSISGVELMSELEFERQRTKKFTVVRPK